MPSTHSVMTGVSYFRGNGNDFLLGCVAYRGPLNIKATRFSPAGNDSRKFADLEAAAVWVESNTQFPDLALYPENHSVYGPVLDSWHGFSLIGSVLARPRDIPPAFGATRRSRIRSVDRATLVVVSPEGQACAKIDFRSQAWHTLVASSDGEVVHRQRRQLRDAVVALWADVGRHCLHASGHAILEKMQEPQDALVGRLDAFLNQRGAWRDRVFTASPDKEEPRIPCTMDPIQLRRHHGGFLLGAIVRGHDGCVATLDARFSDDVVQSPVLDSLDQAVDWIEEHPLLEVLSRP